MVGGPQPHLRHPPQTALAGENSLVRQRRSTRRHGQMFVVAAPSLCLCRLWPWTLTALPDRSASPARQRARESIKAIDLSRRRARVQARSRARGGQLRRPARGQQERRRAEGLPGGDRPGLSVMQYMSGTPCVDVHYRINVYPSLRSRESALLGFCVRLTTAQGMPAKERCAAVAILCPQVKMCSVTRQSPVQTLDSSNARPRTRELKTRKTQQGCANTTSPSCSGSTAATCSP